MEQRVAPLDMDEGPLRKWARSELKLARWPMVPQDFEREVSDIHPMMQHLANAIAGLQCDSLIRTSYYVWFQGMQGNHDHLAGMSLMLIMVLIHPGIDQNIGSRKRGMLVVL
jgi:hypothetical protein